MFVYISAIKIYKIIGEIIGVANVLLNNRLFQFVANNMSRADFNERYQSMSNV
ncbi:hypothetical protein HIE71_002433 [Escherichia coli]|nr:hypothetical protein [Escherichia coli]